MPISLCFLLVVAQATLAPVTLVGHGDDAEHARDPYSAADWQALERGEILTYEDSGGTDREDGGAQRSMRAAAIVTHPPELAWAALADFEKRPEFLPGAKEIRVARRDGNRVWLDERLQFLLVTIRYRVISTLEPERGLMSWTLDESAPHDIEQTDGAWQLTALEGGARTLVRYRVHVLTGKAIPGFLESYLMKRSLPALLGGLRTEVNRRAQMQP